MKSSGSTLPPSGWRQRTSASTPINDRSSREKSGWYRTNSSAPSIARLSSNWKRLPQRTNRSAGVESPIAVPACLLGLVHHSVGVADQVVGFGEGIAGDDDPDAAGDGEVMPILDVGGTDPVNDAVADETDVIVVAQIPAQHDELVAAEAGDGVGFPGQERPPAPAIGEHLVAGVVAEPAVVLLQAG